MSFLAIVVQKFGGTSISTPELRTRVCDIIASTINSGQQAVVVVSAMGRVNDPYATDTFVNLMKETNPNPAPRELDLIMSCGELISAALLASQLSGVGLQARCLTGEQAGLITDGNYGNAHIQYVNPRNIIACLEDGYVPIVTGFQGVSENGELTTLGRGGSDTTASALGVALNAEVIDIFTDVEGVMTADPRIVNNARLLDSITYNEICQLARDGAKVVHPRAIEIAMQGNIPLRVRSTFSDSPGTWVSNQPAGRQNEVRIIRDRLIAGITYTSNLAQLKVKSPAETQGTGLELQVFSALAREQISVDFINVQPELISFTVAGNMAKKAVEVLQSIEIYPDIEHNCAKVAVVGAAMTGIPGVMARVVEALTQRGIPILQSGDSYTNIWCLVKKEHMEEAVKALHDQFELGNK
ncbi:MAG: aspartate kinase [Deltaproteobacteria bacterium]